MREEEIDYIYIRKKCNKDYTNTVENKYNTIYNISKERGNS